LARVPNFPLQDYHWLLASTEGITGFDSSAFEVDASAFTAFHGPRPDHRFFCVSRTGNQLNLSFVPEPTSGMQLMVLGVATAMRRRRSSHMKY
jgi:hypothetical protein